MCLAIPARLVERLSGDEGVVAWSEVRRPVRLELVPEVKVGDWVLVHTGYVLEVLDPAEAARSIALFAEMDADVGG